MSPRDPEDVEAYERDLAGVVIGGAERLTSPIEVRAYNPAWPALYEREAARIRSVLGERVIRLEHVGSTSVPGLPAKPIVLFKGPDTEVNVHVFPAGCEELDRMLLFRDHLRMDAADRGRYAAAKRELAARPWRYVQQYADAKTAVVREIMARAEAGSDR